MSNTPKKIKNKTLREMAKDLYELQPVKNKTVEQIYKELKAIHVAKNN